MNNKVVIIISGGAVQSISKPKGLILEIRDYDVDDDWEGNVKIDEDGDRYQEMLWGEEEIEG